MVAGGNRPKRLLLIAGVAVLVAGGAAAAWQYRQRDLDERARAFRETGRAALAAGEYEKALDGIGRFLQRLGDREATAEDYVLYAKARLQVPDKNGNHVQQALGMLQRALALEPDRRDAQSELLSLYTSVGYSAEALALLDSMLTRAPRDLSLLRKRRDLLASMRKFREALKAASAVNELEGVTLDDYVQALEIRFGDEQPRQTIDAWVESVLHAHRLDPRFEVLSVAAALHGGTADAKQVNDALDRVLKATAAADDAEFLSLLVRLLDSAGRFEESLRVLDRMKDGGDGNFRREIVRRLWFARRDGEIPERVAKWGREEAEADPEIAAIEAASLYLAGRRPEADAIRKALAGRSDPVSQAWSAFVESAAGDRPPDLATIQSLSRAAAAAPGSILIRQALGDAHAALGDFELAIRDWQIAADATPLWSRPLLSIAKARLATPGREHLADVPARAALRRSPRSLDVVRTAVEAMSVSREGLDARVARQMLDMLASAQTTDPGAAGELVALRALLLIRVDRTQAEVQLKEALNASPALSQVSLLRLARAAGSAGLAIERHLFDKCEEAHGATPELALARATAASREGDPELGLRTLDEMRTRAPAGQRDFDWALVRASYLAATRSPESAAAWLALADAHPANLTAQLGALGSARAWSDRATIGRVIGRVKELAGEDSTTYRIARARWVLGDPSATDADVADVASLLDKVVNAAPSSATAHQLLAKAFERLKNLPAAEREMQLAATCAPESSWVSLELARLALRQGHSAEVRSLLERARAAGDLEPVQVEQAACLLALQGDTRAGADLLEPLTAGSQSSRRSLHLLAQLYARLGETDRALALCERLLARPDAEVVELAAGLYAAKGRTAEADAVIARLDATNSRPGDRELVIARHLFRWGPPGVARDAYRKAADAAPERADVWLEFLERAIGAADADAVASILDDPRARRVEAIAFAHGIRELFSQSVRIPFLHDVLNSALTDVADRPALTKALAAMRAAAAGPQEQRDAAAAVRVIAESNSSVVSLQLLAARMCASIGDLQRARQIAGRAMSQFPDSAAAARVAAEILAGSGRRAEALEAGIAWRERAGGDLQADTFVAGELLLAGRAADAATALAPKLPSALERPADNERLLSFHALALARSGRTADASKLLADLAARDAAWRRIPLQLSSEWMGDAAGASAWLGVCAGLVVDDDADGRLRLARAYGAAWERFQSPALLERARANLDTLVASPDCAADAHFAAAMIAHQTGNLAAAQRSYEAAIARDAKLAEALNNLAMLLADSGDWKAAVERATSASKAEPKNANYLDTLAYALRKGREFAKAKACLEEAIRLDPANAGWRLSLGETLAESGDLAGAAQTVVTVDELVTAGAVLSQADGGRLDRLRVATRTPR